MRGHRRWCGSRRGRGGWKGVANNFGEVFRNISELLVRRPRRPCRGALRQRRRNGHIHAIRHDVERLSFIAGYRRPKVLEILRQDRYLCVNMLLDLIKSYGVAPVLAYSLALVHSGLRSILRDNRHLSLTSSISSSSYCTPLDGSRIYIAGKLSRPGL